MLFICLENLAKSPNNPILFGYFRDLAKFSQILHEHKILSEHSHLATISLLLWLDHRAKHCQIFTKKLKWEKKIIFSWSIRENLAKSPKYRIVQGVWFFHRYLDRLLGINCQFYLGKRQLRGAFTDCIWRVFSCLCTVILW